MAKKVAIFFCQAMQSFRESPQLKVTL